MIEDDICRTMVNRRVARILRAFQFAVEEELLPWPSIRPWRT